MGKLGETSTLPRTQKNSFWDNTSFFFYIFGVVFKPKVSSLSQFMVLSFGSPAAVQPPVSEVSWVWKVSVLVELLNEKRC